MKQIIVAILLLVTPGILNAESMILTCDASSQNTDHPNLPQTIQTFSVPLRFCGVTPTRVRIFVPDGQSCNSQHPGQMGGLRTYWSTTVPNPEGGTQDFQMRGWFIFGRARGERNTARLCQSFFALQSVNPLGGEDASFFTGPADINEGNCESGSIVVSRNEQNAVRVAGQAFSGHMYCTIYLD